MIAVKNEQKPPAYIAFQGGGALGMAHLGAWLEIAKKYHVVGVSGTSAGAIVAAFCAAGFTPEHTIDIFTKLDWKKCVQRQNLIKILWKRDAYSDGSFFHNWLQEEIGKYINREQPDITFSELYERTKIYLAIVAFDLNKKSKVIFDIDEEQASTVSFAVRSSISIPGLFKAMSRVDRKQELVDGGLSLNFPVELLYSKAKESESALIGVRFKDSIKYFQFPNIIETSREALMGAVAHGNSVPDRISEYSKYIDIEIDVSDFDFLNFNLTSSDKKRLEKRGVEAAQLGILKSGQLTKGKKTSDRPGWSPETNSEFDFVEKLIEILHKSELTNVLKRKSLCQDIGIDLGKIPSGILLADIDFGKELVRSLARKKNRDSLVKLIQLLQKEFPETGPDFNNLVKIETEMTRYF